MEPEPKPSEMEDKPEEKPVVTPPKEPQTLDEAKAELERLRGALKDRNREEATRRKKLEELEAQQQRQADERKKAEEETARKQGEFEKLSNQYLGERDASQNELRTANDKLAKYGEIVSSDVDARIKNWPDEVKSLVPTGDDIDALERFARVAELTPLAERLLGTPAKPGAGPTPGSTTGNTPNVADTKKEKRATGNYRV